ncbi:MAG: hypothetical protein ACTSWR_07520, partial [Candidatus Helarchaeota archaeon]
FVNNLIEGIIELCYRNIDGIFNLAGSERISHFGFLKKVAEVFKLNPELIIEDRASNYNWSKLRGPDLSLGIHKSLVNLKSKLLDIESGLEFMKKTYNKNLLDKKNPLIYI